MHFADALGVELPRSLSISTFLLRCALMTHPILLVRFSVRFGSDRILSLESGMHRALCVWHGARDQALAMRRRYQLFLTYSLISSLAIMMLSVTAGVARN